MMLFAFLIGCLSFLPLSHEDMRKMKNLDKYPSEKNNTTHDSLTVDNETFFVSQMIPSAPKVQMTGGYHLESVVNKIFHLLRHDRVAPGHLPHLHQLHCGVPHPRARGLVLQILSSKRGTPEMTRCNGFRIPETLGKRI